MLLPAATSCSACLAWGWSGASRLALGSHPRQAAALAAAAAAALGPSVSRWARADAQQAGFSSRPSGADSTAAPAATGGGSGGGRGADSESGRACESPDAAFRDVMLSRLAALESEVAQLRAFASRRDAGDDDDAGAAAAVRRGGSGSGAAGATALRSPGQEGDADADAERMRSQGAAAAAAVKEEEEERVKEDAKGGAAGTAAGSGAGAGSDDDGSGPSATEAVAEGLSKLHPKITRLVHSGYLESLHHLRQRLMVDEWEGGGRQRALQRGVADFEAQCAEKGLPLGWEELSQLYKDPEDLNVLRDPQLRSAARATLQRVLDERHEKVREGATKLAKELTDGVTHGPSNIISGLWGLLPLPSFLKGGK